MVNIVNKETNSVTKIDPAEGAIRVSSPSDIYLNIASGEVTEVSRSGDDLIITLANGETLVIQDFYLFEDGLVYNSALDGAAIEGGFGALPLAGLGAVGALAAAVGGGGGGDDAGNGIAGEPTAAEPAPADPGIAALEVITASAEDEVNNPAPTVTTFADAGVEGVTEDNLTAVNDAVAAAEGADADSVEEVQAIVDGVLEGIAALEVITASAEDEVNNPAPTVTTFADAGVEGVTEDNLAAVNDAIAAAEGADADSVEEVQAIVDGVLEGIAALEVITASAEDEVNNPAPTVTTFADAGVEGVTEDNLTAVNEAVAAVEGVDADTVEEVQAIVDGVLEGIAALEIITNFAEDEVNNPAPSVDNFADAGVIGVTPENLDAVNEAVAAAEAEGADTVEEVQAIVDGVLEGIAALEIITNFAEDEVNNPAPSVDTFADAGVIGVTPENLDAVNEAVAAVEGVDADTIEEVQAIVDGVLEGIAALEIITNFAEDEVNNPAPSVDNFADAGVIGVTPENLDAVNEAVAAVEGVDADTVEEVQAIVDGVLEGIAALEIITNFAEDEVNNPAPTVTTFADAGVIGVTPENLDAVNEAVAAVEGVDADTVEEVQAIVDGVLEGIAALEIITNFAEDEVNNPAPSVDNFADAGVIGVTPENLDAVNEAVAAVEGVDADTVEEVQAIVDGVLDGIAALEIITNFAEDEVNNPPPTVENFADAGIIGVTPENLEAVNEAIAAAEAEGADSVEEVQAIVDGVLEGIAALEIITNFAEDEIANPPPSVDNFADAGVIGVTEENLDAVNEAVAAVEGVDADTVEEVQALVDNVNNPPNPEISIGDIALDDNNAGFVIRGVDAGDRSGGAVSNAGDVNGDGLDDFIIGAVRTNPNGTQSGTSYVVFGQEGGVSVDLASLEAGTGNGFVINGEAARDNSGFSVSGGGDINGDGLADLIVGAPFSDANGEDSGSGFVVFGKADTGAVELAELDGTNGFQLPGERAGTLAGSSVSNAGDINGDGFDDLIVGSPGADAAVTGNGETFIVFGGDNIRGDVLPQNIQLGEGGFTIAGAAAGDASGSAVSGAGDVNGDGFDDFIIGVPNAEEAFVVFGGPDVGTFRDLSEFRDGTDGFVITGAAAGGGFGSSVSDAGDVNGDGLADIIIGAPVAQANGNNAAGRSFVVFGTTAPATVNVTDLENGIGGFVIEGAARDDDSGISVSGAGDINGDGLDDLIVGATDVDLVVDGEPVRNVGAGFVVFGKEDGTAVDLNDVIEGNGGFVVNGNISGDRAGSAVSGAGDVDGDGFDDLIVGSSLADGPDGQAVGNTFVIFGGGFGSEATQVGGEGNDTLTGGAGVDRLVAGNGDDVVIGGGGADVLRGGAGDDVLAVSDLGFADIDGGNGTDTLRLDATGLTLDLTAVADEEVAGIEQIDLNGGGNTLSFSTSDLLNLSDEGNTLRVFGDDTDTVNVAEGFTANGTVEDAGVTFNVFQNGQAILEIEENVSAVI